MKKIICIALSVAIVCLTGIVAFAKSETPVIRYDGEQGNFVVESGTKDLFPDIKSLMPGDTVTQNITVKNASKNNVDVKLYIRSTGADTASAQLLSKLNITAKQKGGNNLFETVKGESAVENDWVCIGTFKSGASVDLEMTISAPLDLGNEFQDTAAKIGYEFKAEEYPQETPAVPTGDNLSLVIYAVAFVVSLGVIVGIVVVGKKNKKKNDQQ